LRGYPEAGNKKRKGVAAYAGASIETGGLQRTVGTLCADTHPGAYSGQDAYTGRLIPTPHIVQASELRLRGQITEKSVCPTLTAGAKQGDTDPLAVHAISFQPGNLRRKAGADPSTEVFPTVTKDSGDQSPHVATIHPTVTTCTGVRQGCSAEAMSSLSAMSNAGAFPHMAVRRLTPVECERLQGFPDNWSRISWKGKPETECPDGPRYKACGNSMAVPVMAFIGRQIAAVDSTLPPNA
jgi:DNA (cytosine-5)-methyltransferase 1